MRKRSKECLVELQKRFTYSNPEYHKAKAIGFNTRGIPPVLKTYKMTKTEPQQIVFSRGGIKDVRKILKKHGHKVKIEDNRITLPPVTFPDQITLREEQQQPVDKILDKVQGCVRGPCSAGKTVMLLKAIVLIKQPALVVVWETAHQKNWLSEIDKFLGLDKSEIGGCGGVFKKPKFGIINVCMQQSLRNQNTLNYFIDRVGLVGGDEIQRFAARTFQEVVNYFPAKYRIGVSANERRKDGKQFLIYDTFGRVISEMEDKDVGSRRPSKIFLLPTNFHSEHYDETRDRPTVIHEITEDEERNALILKAIKRSIKKKKICLVLTERKAHALNLMFKLKGYSTGLLIGKTTSKEIRESDWLPEWKEFMRGFDATKEYQRIVEKGNDRDIDVIIATQKGDVGINIRTIDHLFITTPSAVNMERFNQQKGRCERDYDEELEDRFGVKDQPQVYYFWDVHHGDFQKAGNSIMRKYKNTKILRLRERRVNHGKKEK